MSDPARCTPLRVSRVADWSTRGLELAGLPLTPTVPPSFVLNLGKDSNNLCLHFNPRFSAHGDTNTIVCNSKDGGAWGTEHREPAFPFQPGSVVEVGWAWRWAGTRRVGWRGSCVQGLETSPLHPM